MKTEVIVSEYSRFIVCGIDRDGRRFRLSYSGDMAGARMALGINLWKGNVYGRRAVDGKRVKLKTVQN